MEEQKNKAIIISTNKESNKNIKQIPFLIKDNFWTKSFFTTSSSLFLNKFSPGQNSHVVEELEKNDFALLGKTSLDEFACGGTGLNAATGPVFNPFDKSFITGGSSSGSAWSVAKDIVPFAIGHDTGDSVRRPAAFCGIIGYKPSYGLVSRFGVIPMSSSLDTVGIFSKKIEYINLAITAIKKKDPRDLTNVAFNKNTLNKEENIKKGQYVAVIANLTEGLDPKLKKNYQKYLEIIKKMGYIIKEINIPENVTAHMQITYLAICSSELTSHLNSLQGVTFGANEENLTEKTRTDKLGTMVKQRLLLGAYFLDNNDLLIKARRNRSIINDFVKKIFEKFDFFIFPSSISTAPSVKDINDSLSGLISNDWRDNLLLLANFSGIPSINIPMGFIDNLPLGLNINCDFGNDKILLEFAEKIEKEVLTRND